MVFSERRQVGGQLPCSSSAFRREARPPGSESGPASRYASRPGAVTWNAASCDRDRHVLRFPVAPRKTCPPLPPSRSPDVNPEMVAGAVGDFESGRSLRASQPRDRPHAGRRNPGSGPQGTRGETNWGNSRPRQMAATNPAATTNSARGQPAATPLSRGCRPCIGAAEAGWPLNRFRRLSHEARSWSAVPRHEHALRTALATPLSATSSVRPRTRNSSWPLLRRRSAAR